MTRRTSRSEPDTDDDLTAHSRTLLELGGSVGLVPQPPPRITEPMTSEDPPQRTGRVF